MSRRRSTTWTSLRTGPRSGGHATPGPKPRRTCRKNFSSPRGRAAGSTATGWTAADTPVRRGRRYSEAVTVWAALTTLLQQEGLTDARRRHVPGRAAYR